jgi:exonuclease III
MASFLAVPIFYFLIIFLFIPDFNSSFNSYNSFNSLYNCVLYQCSCMHVMNFSLAIQNCNSLNMSHSTAENQKLKIAAITNLNKDVILLSDIRLANKNLSTCKSDMEKCFLINSTAPYTFVANSTKNKRGVGILIKKSLPAKILSAISDPEENFLLLKIEIKSKIYILGAVYGPNEHNPDFFRSLYTSIKNLGEHPIILGGDFNCTFSPEKLENNIDCLHMKDVPNLRHSIYLNEMCSALEITDPFRHLHPNKKSYSYWLFGSLRKNRSRIDFFLTSISLLSNDLRAVLRIPLLAASLTTRRSF